MSSAALYNQYINEPWDKTFRTASAQFAYLQTYPDEKRAILAAWCAGQTRKQIKEVRGWTELTIKRVLKELNAPRLPGKSGESLKCTACGLLKPFSAFECYKATGRPGRHTCKLCRNRAKCNNKKEEREDFLQRERAEGRACNTCGAIKALDDFSRHGRKCKRCQLDRQNEVARLRTQERWGPQGYVPPIHPKQSGVPEGYRRCPKCKEVKERTLKFFCKRSNSPTPGGDCRKCRSRANTRRKTKKRRNQSLPTRQDIIDACRNLETGERRCCSCKRWFPETTDYFKRRRSRERGEQKLYHPVCRACRNAIEKGRRNRAPKWLTDAHWDDIFLMYYTAAEITRSTLVPHVVDHMQPLNGEDRSGLHVPWNLSIITAYDNSRKSNLSPEEWVRKKFGTP